MTERWILLGVITALSTAPLAIGVSLQKAGGADASVLTLEFLGKIDSNIIHDSYLILKITKIAYEIKFSDLQAYLNLNKDDRFHLDTMIGQFANYLQDLSCEQFSCKERSVCDKFDMSRVFSESDIEIIVDWILQIPDSLRHDMQKQYSKDNVQNIIKGLINIHYPRLYSFLTEKEVPESITKYLNKDNPREISAEQKAILQYIRFYIAKAYYMKGLETLIEMVSATTRHQVKELVSGEVSCRKPSIADIFDASFMDKVDQATLFSPQSARKIAGLAKKIGVLNVRDFFGENQDYREEQKKAITSFYHHFERFSCEILDCRICHHADACHVLSTAEKSEILTIIAFPPDEVLKEFSLKYDAKSAYFNMKDIFEYKVAGPLYENIKNAFDVDHNGNTDAHEMQFVNFVWFVMDYFLAQRAVTVMKDMVFSQTRDELEGFANHQAYCLAEDISDSRLMEAIDSSLLRNHDLLRSLIQTSISIGHTLPGDYFQMNHDHQDEVEDKVKTFILDFHRFLCDNFPCHYGGQCVVMPMLETITAHDREAVQELVMHPDVMSISVMPEFSKQTLSDLLKKILRGDFGDPSMWNEVPEDTLTAVLDVNANHELDEEEWNINTYARLRIQEYLIQKIRQTIVDLVNAKMPYIVDERIHNFVGCRCSIGFGGEHCEECKVPEWLMPGLYGAPPPIIL